MFNFSLNYTIACVATVMILLQIATIYKYCYNNKINKTTTADKWFFRYKWQFVKILLYSFTGSFLKV